MTVSRGEIWFADLNPTQGSDQSGTRPLLTFQNNSINLFTATFLTIPLTPNLRRASLPTCALVLQGTGRLKRGLGVVGVQTMAKIEKLGTIHYGNCLDEQAVTVRL